MRRIGVYLVAIVAAIAGLVLAGGIATAAGPKPLAKAPKITGPADYKAGGSVGDAWVKDAQPDTKVLLVNTKNRVVRKGKTDRFGSFVFYDVTPGATYSVRTPTKTTKRKVSKKKLKKAKKLRKKQLKKCKTIKNKAKRKACTKRAKKSFRKRTKPVVTRLGTGTAKFKTLKPGDNPPAAFYGCLLYTSPSPRDGLLSRMPSSA